MSDQNRVPRVGEVAMADADLDGFDRFRVLGRLGVHMTLLILEINKNWANASLTELLNLQRVNVVCYWLDSCRDHYQSESCRPPYTRISLEP
jgi:hypothetical protein